MTEIETLREGLVLRAIRLKESHGPQLSEDEAHKLDVIIGFPGMDVEREDLAKAEEVLNLVARKYGPKLEN